MTPFTFQNSRGGPTYVIQGEGRQTFFQGAGVQLLSDRTRDCPRSRTAKLSRNVINYSDSLFQVGCLFSSFIMYPPRGMLYSN